MKRCGTRWLWPVLLAIAIATALLLAPRALTSASRRVQQLPPMGTQPLDQISDTSFDQAFLFQMTMHDAMGVMMTQTGVVSRAHQDQRTAST